jgi:hypothetical protein
MFARYCLSFLVSLTLMACNRGPDPLSAPPQPTTSGSDADLKDSAKRTPDSRIAPSIPGSSESTSSKPEDRPSNPER